MNHEESKDVKRIAISLDKEILRKIDYLVNDARQFVSRDDFIGLACHEFVVRRAGAVPIPD